MDTLLRPLVKKQCFHFWDSFWDFWSLCIQLVWLAQLHFYLGLHSAELSLLLLSHTACLCWLAACAGWPPPCLGGSREEAFLEIGNIF